MNKNKKKYSSRVEQREFIEKNEIQNKQKNNVFLFIKNIFTGNVSNIADKYDKKDNISSSDDYKRGVIRDNPEEKQATRGFLAKLRAYFSILRLTKEKEVKQEKIKKKKIKEQKEKIEIEMLINRHLLTKSRSDLLILDEQKNNIIKETPINLRPQDKFNATSNLNSNRAPNLGNDSNTKQSSYNKEKFEQNNPDMAKKTYIEREAVTFQDKLNDLNSDGILSREEQVIADNRNIINPMQKSFEKTISHMKDNSDNKSVGQSLGDLTDHSRKNGGGRSA